FSFFPIIFQISLLPPLSLHRFSLEKCSTSKIACTPRCGGGATTRRWRGRLLHIRFGKSSDGPNGCDTRSKTLDLMTRPNYSTLRFSSFTHPPCFFSFSSPLCNFGSI
ncbi:hypothetical protein AABB24_002062, partial [Solanum stoloniferum]